MPVLHIGDVEIVARTEQLTSPTLKIKNAAGEIYHVAVVPLGGGVYDATETLVYEEESINTCQTVILSAGIYRVEMRGGSGGKPYRCNAGMGKLNAKSDVLSTIFKLNTETVVYSFRGGDGNDSGVIDEHSASGGGASGVDSMLVVGDRIIRANGAAATRCSKLVLSILRGGGIGLNGSSCQGGAGGIVASQNTNDAGNAFINTTAFFLCSGGGGGANASGGGVGGTGLTSASISGTAGTSASSDGGGDGGDAENLNMDSINQNYAIGGKGGANVYYSCGGQTAVSYGGGGGGALCSLRYDYVCENLGAWCYSSCHNGGDGGSGSIGTSNDSYLKIYKIG